MSDGRANGFLASCASTFGRLTSFRADSVKLKLIGRSSVAASLMARITTLRAPHADAAFTISKLSISTDCALDAQDFFWLAFTRISSVVNRQFASFAPCPRA